MVLSEKIYGPGFWVYWVYSYLVLLIATVLTLRLTLRSSTIFRWQSILVVIGILVPWAGNLLYVLHINPFTNLDLTPLAFSITSIMLATGMFRWRLFDIKPIAQAAVIAGMADGLIILDNQDRIVEANPAAQVILGLGVQEMIGKPMEQVFANQLSPDERSRWMREKRIEIKLTRGRETRNYEFSASPFYTEHGSPGGSIIFLHDVTDWKRLEERLWETERKHAEALLRESEDRYKTLYENMAVGVIYQSADGKVTDANPMAERILGMELAQMSDPVSIRANLMTVHDDGSDFPAEEHPSMVSLKTGQSLRNQLMGVYFPNEKKYHWINTNTVPQFMPGDDKPYQVFVTFDDITERKRAERRYRELFEQAPAMYVISRNQGGIPIIIDCNQSFLSTLGYARAEVMERPLTDFYAPESRAKLLGGGYQRALEGDVSNERQLLARDGRVFETVFQAKPELDVQGRASGVRAMYVDITERKQMEAALRASQDRYRRIVETAREGIWILDVGGKTTFVNRRMTEMLGYLAGDMLSAPLFAFVSEKDYALAADLLERRRQSLSEQHEFRFRRRDGTALWAIVEASPILDEHGKPAGTLAMVTDITERKRAEEALAQERNLLRTLVDNLPDKVYVKDAACRYVVNNPTHLRSLGATQQKDVLGKTAFDFFPQPLAEQFNADEQEIIRSGQPLIEKEEIVADLPTGRPAWHLTTKVPVRDSQGKVVGLLGVSRDITERKRAEEALRASEEKFRLIAENSAEDIWQLDLEGHVTYVSPAEERIFGYTAGEASKLRFDNFIAGADLAKATDAFARAIAGERVQVLELTGIRKDGSSHPIEVSVTPVVKDERVIGVQGIARDISERKRAETELHIALEKYRVLFESFPLGISVTDAAGDLVEANRESERLLGIPRDEHTQRKYDGSEWRIVRPDGTPMPPDEYASVRALREKRLVENVEMGIVKGGGEITWISVTAAPIPLEGYGVAITYGDVTKDKQAEEKMRMLSRDIIAAREQERKQVSSVLHHDVGSLAVGISAHLDAIEADFRSGKVGEALNWMKRTRKLFDESVVRLKGLAVQLRPPELDVLGLPAALRQHFAQVTERVGARIHFRENLGRRRVSGDTATILFRVAQEALTNALTHGHATRVDVGLSASKKEVRLTVRNDGKGFDPSEHWARATSRMGLRVMREMVAAAEGAFTIDSGRGKRTTVRVRLPLADCGLRNAECGLKEMTT